MLDKQSKLRDLTRFPIINLTNIGRSLAQPYRLLCTPAVIVVDRNGVIVDIFRGPLKQEVLLNAAIGPDWMEEKHFPPAAPHPNMAQLNPREREMWTLYVFEKDLNKGTSFSRAFATRGSVDSKHKIPSNVVTRLDAINGKILNRFVRKGEPICEEYFNSINERNNASINGKQK